jgi:multidrug resistance efflux pump
VRSRKGVASRKNSEINNEEDFSIVFDSSLNQLREKTRTERSTSSTLSNRMNYLEIDLKRKKQMVQMAKTKYQRLMEVRHQSFVEKKELTKVDLSLYRSARFRARSIS